MGDTSISLARGKGWGGMVNPSVQNTSQTITICCPRQNISLMSDDKIKPIQAPMPEIPSQFTCYKLSLSAATIFLLLMSQGDHRPAWEPQYELLGRRMSLEKITSESIQMNGKQGSQCHDLGHKVKISLSSTIRRYARKKFMSTNLLLHQKQEVACFAMPTPPLCSLKAKANRQDCHHCSTSAASNHQL